MRAGAVLLLALLTLTANGCKVKERTAVSTASKVETASEAHRDSIRIATRDRVIFRTDTVTVREVVREYGAPVLVRDTVCFTPLIRETVRETESGAREEWQARTDILTRDRSDASFNRADTSRTETKTEDKSGRCIAAIVIGALAILLYFAGKRLDKYL